MIAARGGHVSGRGVYAFTGVAQAFLADGNVARRFLRGMIRRELEAVVGGRVGPIRYRLNPFERDLNFYAPPACPGLFVLLATALEIDEPAGSVAVPVAVQSADDVEDRA